MGLHSVARIPTGDPDEINPSGPELDPDKPGCTMSRWRGQTNPYFFHAFV